MNDQDWTPAIIATSEHCLKYHLIDPGEVTRLAGEKILVRQNFYALAVSDWKFRHLGCTGQQLEVHPDDVARLWPHLLKEDCGVSVCDCQLLMD